MSPHVLFIGLGGIGQRHLRNARKVLGPDARLSAYRVRRETTLLNDQLLAVEGGNLEQEYLPEIFDDLELALGQEPTIAIIANPTSLHIPVAEKALKAGCHLFIEKPLSHDLTGVAELIHAAEKMEKTAFVAYQLRFHPAVKALIREVATGRCGTIYGARAEVAEYLPNFHPYEDYRRMYASRSDLGGGVTLTQIHEIDLIYRLFGMPESAWSVGGKISNLEVDVEDSATSLLRFKRADGRGFAVELHQDYLGRPPRRSLSVWGSEGKLDLNLRQGRLDFVTNDGAQICLVDAKDHPRNQLFEDELRHFLNCVEKRTPTEVPLKDGAASLEIALGLLKSQATGNLVHWPSDEAAAA